MITHNALSPCNILATNETNNNECFLAIYYKSSINVVVKRTPGFEIKYYTNCSLPLLCMIGEINCKIYEDSVGCNNCD